MVVEEQNSVLLTGIEWREHQQREEEDPACPLCTNANDWLGTAVDRFFVLQLCLAMVYDLL